MSSTNTQTKTRPRALRRLALLLFGGLLLFSTVSSSLTSIASAMNVRDMNITERAQSWALLNAVTWCIREGGDKPKDPWRIDISGGQTSLDEWKSGDWWLDNDVLGEARHAVPASYLAAGVGAQDGFIICNEALKQGAEMWGFGTDFLGLLCSFVDNRRENGASCASNSSENFDRHWVDNFWEDFYNEIVRRVYNGTPPDLNNAEWYLLYSAAFKTGCEASPVLSTTPDNRRYEDVKTVLGNGTISTKDYEGVEKSTNRHVSTGNSLNGFNFYTLSCEQIAAYLSETAQAFSDYAADNPGETTIPPPPGEVDCNLTPRPSGCEGTQSTSCVVDGVGWIVCSMANFVAQATDGVYSLIEEMVKVPVINTDTASGTNGVYTAWSIMRTFANVLFVIGFLIIILSQLTGLGISNYGVKKTLPRLVVAAILVNVSFWLSAIAVDLSNIIGAGLYDILSGIKNDMNIGISDGNNWANILSALLGGSAIAINGGIIIAVAGVALSTIPGIGLALLFIAIPLVLAALLAVLVVVFVLVARQALVVLLIIISPLAFVALLLPNTEKLFTKWRQTLVSLLLLYPIVSIIFGGAQIAGLSIMATAANYGDQISQANAVGVGLAILTGQLVMIIPFFFIPTILIKFSGGNLDSIAGTLRTKGKSLIGGIGGASRKYGMQRLGRGWGSLKYRRQSGRPSPGLRGSLGSAMSGLGKAYDERKASETSTDEYLQDQKGASIRKRLGTDATYATRSAGGDYKAGQQIAARAVAAAEAEELKKALQPLLRQLASMDPSAKEAHLNAEVAAGGARAAAALHHAANIGDSGFIDRNLQSTNAETVRMTREAINANASSLLGKAPDLVKGAQAAFTAVKAEDLAGMSKDTAKRYMQWLESQRTANPPLFASASSSFNNALEGIKLNPTLQGKFGDETGRELISHATPEIAAAAPTMGSIDSSGKIR